jgi:hypothetical protein
MALPLTPNSCAVARGGSTGRLPCRAQTKGDGKNGLRGRGTGPDNLLLVIQFQDEKKILQFLPRAQKFLATAPPNS